MAALVFTYDVNKDVNPDDLADKLAAQFNLTTPPDIGLDHGDAIITHPQLTEANRTAVQNAINSYTLDTGRVALPAGTLGTLLNKARTALATNTTFLGLGTPTNAQVLAEVQALARQNDAIIKALLIYIAGQQQDTTGT